jgi:hypothetical protein
MLTEELGIDYDEYNLGIEGETVSEESSNEMSESESESETSVVACWWVGRRDSVRRCTWGNATNFKIFTDCFRGVQ